MAPRLKAEGKGDASWSSPASFLRRQHKALEGESGLGGESARSTLSCTGLLVSHTKPASRSRCGKRAVASTDVASKEDSAVAAGEELRALASGIFPTVSCWHSDMAVRADSQLRRLSLAETG
mmetsp:Transcript_36180/g.84825  ORF Transcript_36180/g.84825 Transcript_36180/m.84825 type:complete len:122 (+) Transcript_36180:520-885(+)